MIAESGWFAARPSGTEDVYKIYAESFRSEGHLLRIHEEAKDVLRVCREGNEIVLSADVVSENVVDSVPRTPVSLDRVSF